MLARVFLQNKTLIGPSKQRERNVCRFEAPACDGERCVTPARAAAKETSGPLVSLTCWCTSRLRWTLRSSFHWDKSYSSGGHCTHPTGGPVIHLKHKKNLPDAGGTVIKEAVLSR